MTLSTMHMKDLFEKVKSLGPKEVVLDVRSAEEFQAGHVPGSKNIPHDQVASHLDELRKFDRIYIHCQMGGRAGKAATELDRLGLKTVTCIASSGMKDWLAAGFPVQK